MNATTTTATSASQEAWKRVRHLAHRSGLLVTRSDERDGPVCYFTMRCGFELRHHGDEAALLAYLRGLPR